MAVTVRIPRTAVEIGGALHDWYYNKCLLRTEVNTATDDTWATAEDGFILSIAEVNNILIAGGEVEGYLMAVRAPIALMDISVPDTLPNHRKLDATASLVAKAFSDWLVPGSEIWLKDDNTEVLFYTNPFAKGTTEYLKGSEIKIINDISAQVICLTIADAQVLTATGWTKL